MALASSRSRQLFAALEGGGSWALLRDSPTVVQQQRSLHTSRPLYKMKEFKLDPSLSSSSSSSSSSAASSSRSAAEQRHLLDELRQAASSSSSSSAAARFPSQPNATAERLLDSQGQRAPMPPGLGGSLLGDYPLPRRRGLVAKATGEGQSWQELRSGQKVARTAFKGSQVGLVLFGSAFTLVISYALLSELFAPNSPTVIYKDACRRVEDNKEVSRRREW